MSYAKTYKKIPIYISDDEIEGFMANTSNCRSIWVMSAIDI